MPRISVCFQFVIVILFVKTNFASDKLINNSNEVMPEKTPWNGRFEPCFDEELNCPDLIKNGECFGFFIDTDGKMKTDSNRAIPYLFKCRQSCREHFIQAKGQLDNNTLNQLYRAGGLLDHIEDMFGHVYPLCDLSQGYHYQARTSFIGSYFKSVWAYESDLIPTYTKTGIKRDKMSKKLFGEIRDYLDRRIRFEKWVREDCLIGMTKCQYIEDDGYSSSVIKNHTTMQMNRLTIELHDKILDELKPLAEKWSGQKLAGNNVYGVRRYTRGAWLATHTDHMKTHIISAIINVGQKVDEPWPLDIVDHQKNKHKIYLKPGDMLWYESAKLMHGRATPLNGDYFDNIFVHFRIWNEEDQRHLDEKNAKAKKKENDFKVLF